MTTGLQAITKALKSATSRWEAVEPAFLKLPEGQFVIVHQLISGRQKVARVEAPEVIAREALAFALSRVQILGYYRFDESTWELASDMLDAVSRVVKDVPKLLEEQLMDRLLEVAVVRDDLTKPVPDDMEEFFLHRVGNDQCIMMASAEEDISHVPEHPLGRLIARKGTVAMYWPAIEMERMSELMARELGSIFEDFIGTLHISTYDRRSHDETVQRPGGRFGRVFRRKGADNQPAPGMGASEGKDFPSRESENRGDPPYATAGLAGTHRGQAASDIG